MKPAARGTVPGEVSVARLFRCLRARLTSLGARQDVDIFSHAGSSASPVDIAAA